MDVRPSFRRAHIVHANIGRVDYDSLAPEYGAHRAADPVVVAALCRGARLDRASRVLEVGCGTGNYIAPVHEQTGAECVGVDPSREMLAVARARSSGVEFLSGIAEALPVPAGSFDLVFSIDVLHHVGDVRSAVVESARALRSGGRLCIGTEDKEMFVHRIHGRYFPETVEVERARYPRVEMLRAAMADAGLGDVSDELLVLQRRVVDIAPYRDRAFSSLHLIPDDAFERGLERMRRDLERGPIEAEAHRLLLWATAP
jgi:SAM-dependent methyltransferase